MKFIAFALSLLILGTLGNKILSDYLPVTEAHTTLEEIKQVADKFKDLIDKNITQDFDSCVSQIKTNECNLIDEWQSEIEKCKLQNDNSIKNEIPFLKQRKSKKVARLRELIDLENKYNNEMLQLVDQLKTEQEDFKKASWEIHKLYKLPENFETQFVEKSKKKEIDVVRALNANIPRVAENEARKAKEEYDLGEISIQAQTVSEEMLSAYKKLEQTLESIKQGFELRQAEILNEKDQIKEDITRIRALIDSENQLQANNLARIEELQGKSLLCNVLPKNAIKDCAPLKVRASKMETEMDIIETRTQLLFKEIEKLMEENQSNESIQAQKESVKAMKEAAQLREEEESYIEGEEIMPVPEPPKELKPKHHLKEKVE